MMMMVGRSVGVVGAVLMVQLLVVALVSAAGTSARLEEQQPTVTLPCGVKVKGTLDSKNSSLAVFRGLPFAKPPVDNLRFKPAVPKKCPGQSSSVFNATEEPSSCYQTIPFGPYSPSEDCLYLNVWTKGLNNGEDRPQGPQAADECTGNDRRCASSNEDDDGTLSKDLKPILFWIYGGSNVGGSIQAYRGLDNLPREEDLCLVAPNYRLSVFGFLASAALGKDDPRGVSGNYGITDLLAALKWVQHNAKAFGCDPNSVTLYGQSSGGTNIMALLASPGAKGLFHAALSLSPSLNLTQDLAAAERAHMDLIHNTACHDKMQQTELGATGEGESLAKCLRGLSAKALMKAVPASWVAGTRELRPGHDSRGLTEVTGLLAVDGVTLAKPLREAVAKPIVDATLYLSTMRDEEDMQPNATVALWTRLRFDQYLNSTFSAYPAGTVKTLLELFGGPIFATVPQAYYDLGSAVGLNCGSISIGRAAARAFKSPVYVVEVDLAPSHPVRLEPFALQSRFPFHVWDWMMAQRAWDFAIPVGGEVFSPRRRDKQGGALLRQVFLDIVRGANHSTPLLKPVHAPSSSSSYVVNVLQESGDDREVATWQQAHNYRSDMCQRLAAAGFDDRFYWVN